jgi:hypothetical protein
LLTNSSQRIEQMVVNFQSSVELLETVEKNVKFSKCFKGISAVLWLAEQFNISTEFAVLLAELYRKLRVMKPIKEKSTFRDNLEETFFQIQLVNLKKLIHPLMEYYDDKIDDFDEDDIGLDLGGASTAISHHFGKSNIDKITNTTKKVNKGKDVSSNLGFMSIGSNMAKKVQQEKTMKKKTSSWFESTTDDNDEHYKFSRTSISEESFSYSVAQYRSHSLGFNNNAPLAEGILQKRKNDYTDKQTLKVVIGTWNVGEEVEVNSLSNWLHIGEFEADIYAVSLQEIDMSPVTLFKEQSEVSAAWDIILATAIGNKYEKISSHQLVGLYHCMYIKKEYFPHLQNVYTSKLGIGQLGFGNKGGIAIRFHLFENSYCFIGAHLAAHQKNVKERNSNFHDIVKDSLFDNDLFAPLYHDYLFFYGDLNYRVEMDYETALSYIEKKDFDSLLKHDQLKNEMKSKNVFQQFLEGEIKFPPTYKFDHGTDNYDTSEKKRIPAYCDRILMKVRNPKNLKINFYSSEPKYFISDHKPVIAYVDVISERINQEKLLEITNEVFDKLD